MNQRGTIALIETAIRAPSPRNSQPWLFRLEDPIELFADRTRAFPVNDPFDRELTISCGAALFNLRVAAASKGLVSDVQLWPSEAQPDLLARIQLHEAPVDDELARLHTAVEARHTTHKAFQDESISRGLTHQLVAAATAEGAWLQALEGDTRKRAASLIAEGDRIHFSDPSWRRELASWIHPRRTADGVAMPAALAPISRHVVRHVDLGRRVGNSHEALALQAPLLAVLTTERDETEDWLRAGQALERALLVAAARGVQVGYLNQPCQVERLRSRLAELAGLTAVPQIVVRFGIRKAPATRSPRRPLADVLLSGDGCHG